jgi:hypothetical protein
MQVVVVIHVQFSVHHLSHMSGIIRNGMATVETFGFVCAGAVDGPTCAQLPEQEDLNSSVPDLSCAYDLTVAGLRQWPDSPEMLGRTHLPLAQCLEYDACTRDGELTGRYNQGLLPAQLHQSIANSSITNPNCVRFHDS